MESIVQTIADNAIAQSASFMGDFWPIIAVGVGLSVFGVLVGIFSGRRG